MSEKEIKIIFSKNLNDLLYRMQKSQKDIAEIVGVGTSSVSSWCKGEKLPRMDKVDKLCKHFNLKRSDLLEEHSYEPEEYYLNPETRRLAQELYENPERRILFDATRDLTPESIKAVLAIIDNLEKK